MDRPIIFSAPMVRALLREAKRPGTGKTQTRRILKPQPPTPEQFRGSTFSLDRAVADGVKVYSLNDLDRIPKHPTKWDLCGSVGVARNAGFPTTYRVPFGVGDRLWVKENHYRTDDGDEEFAVYACDEEAVRQHLSGLDDLPALFPAEVKARHRKLRPSIHMPRWASRLTLSVTDVRVERLNAISREDAIAEGIQRVGGGMLRWENWSGAEGQSCTSPEAAFALLWNSINGAGAWDANPWVVAVSFDVTLSNIDRMPERPAPVAVPAAAE